MTAARAIQAIEVRLRRAAVRVPAAAGLCLILACGAGGPIAVAQQDRSGHGSDHADHSSHADHADHTDHTDHAAAGPDGSSHRAPGAPLYTVDELTFLQHMIVHHQQALDMAALVPDRTDRARFIRFARYIAGAQAAEIAQMQALLDAARERGVTLPQPLHVDGHAAADPPMHGMLSSRQMADLADASGPAFEQLWLEGMIYHHEGAIDMAMARQLAQLESGRRPYGIDVLIEEMLIEQRAEIHQMRTWLREWGYGRRDDAVP